MSYESTNWRQPFRPRLQCQALVLQISHVLLVLKVQTAMGVSCVISVFDLYLFLDYLESVCSRGGSRFLEIKVMGHIHGQSCS